MVTGWILSKRNGSGVRGLVNTQAETKKRVEAEVKAEVKEAVKVRDKAVDAADEVADEIDRAGLKRLAEMVKNTFGR